METTNNNNTTPPEPTSSKPTQGKERSLIQLAAYDIAHLPQIFGRHPLGGVAGVMIVVVIILLAVVAFMPRRRTEPIATTNPTPVATQPPVQDLSAAAQKERFQQLETQLEELTEDINNLDLLESKLTPPLLDYNIRFNQR